MIWNDRFKLRLCGDGSVLRPLPVLLHKQLRGRSRVLFADPTPVREFEARMFRTAAKQTGVPAELYLL